MALPSSVTLGSLALVVTAGAGLVAVTAYAHRDDASTTSPSATPTSSTPTPKDAEKPRAKPERKHRQQPDVVPDTLVEVYNNSGIAGLAADRAAALQGAGWNVAGTDNWYGNIPQSTVYYPDRLRDQARQLAEVLHIDRLRPAVSPMQFDRLTVILTQA